MKKSLSFILILVLLSSLVLTSCMQCKCECSCCKTTTTTTTTTTWIDDLKILVAQYYDAIDAFEDMFSPIESVDDLWMAHKSAEQIYKNILNCIKQNTGNIHNDVDEILGNEPDEEGNYEFEEARKRHHYLLDELATIQAKINVILDYITKTVRPVICTEVTHYPLGADPEPGKKMCDCEGRGDSYDVELIEKNSYKFKESLLALKYLLSHYEITEQVALDEYLEEYHEIVLISMQYQAKEVVDSYVDETNTSHVCARDACYMYIESILDITFSMVYDEELDVTEDDINDPEAYVWSDETIMVFDWFKVACSIDTYNSFLDK